MVMRGMEMRDQRNENEFRRTALIITIVVSYQALHCFSHCGIIKESSGLIQLRNRNSSHVLIALSFGKSQNGDLKVLTLNNIVQIK